MAKNHKPFDPLSWLDKAVSYDTFRPVLTAVHRDAEQPDMFVTTDTHRMHIARMEPGETPLDVVWAPGQNRVLNPKLQKKVTKDEVVIATYPQWERVTPFNVDGTPYPSRYVERESEDFVEVVFHVDYLLTTLKYMKLACQEDANRVVMTPVWDEGLNDWFIQFRARCAYSCSEVTCRTRPLRLQLSDGKETKRFEDNGHRLPIAFNVTFAIDALTGIPGGEVAIRFYANSRAMQMNFETVPGATAIIMPMSLM